MGNLKKLLPLVATVVAVVLLTAGNGWAVASFAKRYGMVCKSCHSFGAELNGLGQTFKKNGYTFGEKNVSPPVKVEQGKAQDEKAPEASGKNPDKPGLLPPGGITDPTAAPDLLDAEPLPETIVYSCLSSDGTPLFSDSPCVKPQDGMQTVPVKGTKKSSRTGFRPLPAKGAKKVQRVTTKSAVPEPEETVLAQDESAEPPETPLLEKVPLVPPKNFEDCMEKIFVTYPAPASPDVAMKQFRDAENSCALYEKKPKM